MKFVSAHGSTVTVSGEHGGIHDISFDWADEPGCCPDIRPVFNGDLSEPRIEATCGCCGTISIPLEIAG